jgi:hypothetical protein
MEQSPTKSPQKKILRASSESLYSELSPENEYSNSQQNQVWILNKIEYLFMIIFYFLSGK